VALTWKISLTCKFIALPDERLSNMPMENSTCAPDFPYLWLILSSKASSASKVHALCKESSERLPPSLNQI